MPTHSCHSSFEFIRSEQIDSLGIEVCEYKHRVTGAPHYHIAADHEENVFLVALRTVPTDSKGVAHILEHTALCGSERYPVRDPFFMMTRRSLNTFMNAFTSSDWTAYPFASQNRKDFDNLLDVYLDAVFFSRLDEMDFLQEGHRVEFSEADNPQSPLEYKGVVFNEMKGAMSSPVSTLWQTLTKYLFPNNTYHYNSGGDPEAITDLSYEELLAFYKTHYHPSNAIFMTFGNIPAQELQQQFEDRVLSRFEELDTVISVEDEKPYHAPVRIEEAYALDEQDLSNKTHHVMGWVLGHSTSLDEQLEAHLLSRVLLDNSASPLRNVLESSELGAAPSPLCGLEDSNRQMSFMCGIQGSESKHADAFETLVLDTLKSVAEEGVPQEMIEAQLHQLELSQREISGDGYPYGLNLIMSAISPAIHRGDPIALLNLDPAIEALRKKVEDRSFLPELINRYLLNNSHRVRLTMRPDSELAERRDQVERNKLDQIRTEMSDEQIQQVIDQAKALEERQMQVDDESILPKVTKQDVPDEMHIPEGEETETGLTWYGQGTNGLLYQQLIVDLPELSEQELQFMPLFSHCLTELGCGERDFMQNQQYQSEVSGGVSAYSTMRGSVSSEQDVKGYFVVSGKALVRNQQALTALLQDTLLNARFDELPRIREIVSQQRTRKEQSVTGQGHSLAMMAAAARFSPSALVAHNAKGLQSIINIKALDNSLADDTKLAELAEQFKAMHQKIANAPRRFLIVAEPEQKEALVGTLGSQWADAAEITADSAFSLEPTREAVKQLWVTSTQVNFCAKAFPTVSVEHDDSAALTVLGDFLRNGYLHRAIREQGGAYGSGAGQDSGDAVFRFFSYRDPRLEGTLEDFDASIEWLLSSDHDDQKLEEAVLGVVSSIDKPASPAGEAKQAYHSELFGRTAEQRKAFRKRILEVTIDDLKRVAQTYLTSSEASYAIVTNPANAKDLADDYEIIEI